MEKLTLNEIQNNLQEILDCDAFELYADTSLSSGFPNYYIPYMMNDALECYLLFTNCKMTGTYRPEIKAKITMECISNNSTKTPSHTSSAIIFHQGNENVFTLWFEETFRVLHCFRYDRIGHFWVKGAEHWRRLVYIIGTIYDKYEYMGTKVCNEKELALLPLMEFAPFRMYSPIHESLNASYPETSAGLDCITALAKAVNDKAFLKLLAFYKKLPAPFVRKLLFQALNHPKRQKLYELIFYKVQEASMEYPERSYSPAFDDYIVKSRTKVSMQLQKMGFHGNYPLFSRENLQILAMEEHPFTILEAKDFSFRIQFMMSKASDSSGLNMGFFKKRDNQGLIVSNIDDFVL